MPRNTFNNNPNAEDKALALFTDMMIQRLEEMKGDAKWQKPWFSDAAMGWPRNLSNREYQASNAILLKMMCEKNNWRLPVFATFNRLTALNMEKGKDGENLPRVMVNKGEKSCPVFLTSYTVVNDETKEKISYEDYRQLDDEQKKDYSVYPKTHVYNVFCVEQTNLKEARPELYTKLEEQNRLVKPKTDRDMFSIPEVDAMVERQRFFCPILHENKDACYYSISKDHVMMMPKENFKSGESYLSNLLHECSHGVGAVGRLNRFTPERMAQANFHPDEELIAELSAALICSRYSVTKTLKSDTVPYLKSWLDSLKESPSYIKNVMNDVKKASSMIMGRLNEVKLEMEIEKGKSEKQSADNVQTEDKKQSTDYAGTYSIPDWSLPYLINGDPSGLEDEEIEMVDKFVKEHFPNGFVPNIQWDDPTEFNRSPAFGERDPSALTDKGEPNEQREQSGVHSNSAESRGRKSEAQYPFCAVKTFPVDFYTFSQKQELKMEEAKNEQVAKDVPQEPQEEDTVSRGWHR